MPRHIISAGWGFAIFGAGATPDDDSRVRLVAYGHVATQPRSECHLGAIRRTSNASEMRGPLLLGLSLGSLGASWGRLGPP
eukprot:7258116-Pyramimonas_sp.AAC.1